MKTIRYTTQFARMLAGLAVLTAAGLAQAEEAGVVRLSDYASQATFEVADDSEQIVRGQSDLRRRNARTSQALRQMFFGEDAPRPIKYVPPTTHPTLTGGPYMHPTGPSQAAVSYSVQPAAAQTAAVQPTAMITPAPAPPAVGSTGAPCDAPACCPNTCDGSSACCDAGGCCDTNGCCDANGCCPNGCDGYGNGNGCNNGNGNSLFGRRDGKNACPQCGGNGCPACGGRGNGLLSGRRCGRNGGNACGRSGLFGGCFHGSAANYRARNLHASSQLNAYLRCKLGYFLHDGSGGVGSPLFGHYKIVYPVNPGYFDGRDGNVYSAAGYGGPVSVPLAPNVRHAYNYGWGIPSSRLTPVSNVSTP